MKTILSNAVSLSVVLIVLLAGYSAEPFYAGHHVHTEYIRIFGDSFNHHEHKESLEFSIFPSLLLITTLFRIGLNVSSTRLILTRQGEAGAVN